MKDPQSPGDTPPAEFRKQLHELADWIADFRENIEQLRVAPDDKPGAIREQLPRRAPEEGEPFEQNSHRRRSHHCPGHGALESPDVSRLLRLD